MIQCGCNGCDKRQVGCRQNCISWKVYEHRKRKEELEKRQVYDYRNTHETEYYEIYKEYCKEKGKPIPKRKQFNMKYGRTV